jgi:hypothetical protein
MQPAAGIPVTVVYATPTVTHERALRVPAGTTLREAVVMSGLLAQVPALSVLPPQALDLGVFNRSRPADTPVRAGDRIEVYRPLTVDPKEARRIRAEVRRRRAAA